MSTMTMPAGGGWKVEIDESTCIVLITPQGERRTVTDVASMVTALESAQTMARTLFDLGLPNPRRDQGDVAHY